MIGKSTKTPASTPCMANDNAAVHGFRLLKVPLDSTRLSSNIPALLVFTTDTGNSKLAPAIGHDCAAVDSERTDGLVAIWGFIGSYPRIGKRGQFPGCPLAFADVSCHFTRVTASMFLSKSFGLY